VRLPVRQGMDGDEGAMYVARIAESARSIVYVCSLSCIALERTSLIVVSAQSTRIRQTHPPDKPPSD